MSDLLSIGASGVNAYRSALAAIGDNVANAETQGYARRNVILRESATFAPGQSGALNFGGVKAVSVDRAWDDYQAADSRISAS
ncbi:MAG TPA: flagellar basal body protein, partial [Allosphingosinicella sp.]